MSLLDLDTYKTYKGINSDKDDNQLDGIISSVNSFVKSYCGRTFNEYIELNKVEYFNSFKECEVYLVEAPLIELVRVEISNDYWDTSVLLVEKVDYIIDKKDARLLTLSNNVFGQNYLTYNTGEDSLKVTYKGGYASIPSELHLATVYLTEYYYKQDYTPIKSLGSNRVENSLGYISENKIPGHIKRALDLYRWVE